MTNTEPTGKRTTLIFTPRGQADLELVKTETGTDQTTSIHKALAFYAHHLRNNNDGGWTEHVTPDGTHHRLLTL